MRYEKVLKGLSKYSKKAISEHLDGEVAEAVQEAKRIVSEFETLERIKDITMTNLLDCKNELCERCGNYKQSYLGACDDCRWHKIAAGGSGI